MTLQISFLGDHLLLIIVLALLVGVFLVYRMGGMLILRALLMVFFLTPFQYFEPLKLLGVNTTMSQGMLLNNVAVLFIGFIAAWFIGGLIPNSSRILSRVTFRLFC